MTKEEHAKVLPPLPMPFIKLQGRNSRTKAQSEMMELFSADQMREYALAAIMRKEPEPISDAEILDLWEYELDEASDVLAFARKLLEKAK